MKKTLFANFKPIVQLQVFLSTLFRLQKLTAKKPHSFEFIRSEVSFWNEDLGILLELKTQVKNLLHTYPMESITGALETVIRACEKGEEPEWLSLFQCVSAFIQQCEPDENLYYFLLRHQEDCKNTFGRLFLFNLFNKKGLKQIEQFLLDKYHERGFFHLKTSISTHFEGLSHASCLPTTDSTD